MRVFIGVEPPDLWRRALAAGCLALKELDPHWNQANWVPPENLHITLKFMGDVADDSARSLSSDLAVVLRGFNRFALPVRDLLWPVGGVRNATMLWTTFDDPDESCAMLVSHVEDLAANYGVVPDSRTFNPHITLARTRRPMTLRYRAEAVEAIQGLLGNETMIPVNCVTVFKSTLTKHRAYYESLGSVQLGA